MFENRKLLVLMAGACATLLFVPTAANAESAFATADHGPISASAHLDFTIVVPRFVSLQVGTGADRTTNGTVDNISFEVPAGEVGNGSQVLASQSFVTARVAGNGEGLVLSATTQGPMMNDTGDSISYNELDVTVSADSSSVPLAHPPLADGATSTIVLPSNARNVTELDAKWQFAYRNRLAAAPGTYGGSEARNGRVRYSVSMP